MAFVSNKTTSRRDFGGQLQRAVRNRRIGLGKQCVLHAHFQLAVLSNRAHCHPPQAPAALGSGSGAASGHIPSQGSRTSLHLPGSAALELPAAAATHLGQRRPCAGH